MNPIDVRELIRRLQAAYPDPPLSDESEKLYIRLLDDLDYAILDSVFDDLIATLVHRPTIAQIRRAVVEPTLDVPTADEAWFAIQTHQRDVHPLVAHVTTLMGGSYNIRTSEDPELTRVRFVKAYDNLRWKEVNKALTEGLKAQRMRLSKAS